MKRKRKRNELRKPTKIVKNVGKTALVLGTTSILIGMGKGMIKGNK